MKIIKEFADKNLRINTQKAFSDYKDSTTSTDSETKLFAKKLAENSLEKLGGKIDRKASKFKPPITPMKDESEINNYEFLETFKSQKDVEKMEKCEELHAEKMRLKEAKLKETYYLIKLYMIIVKTATLFSKNPIDTSKI